MMELRFLLCGVVVVAMTRAAHAGDACAPPAGTNPYADPSLASPHDAQAEKDREDGKALHRASDYEGAIKAFTAGYVIEEAPVFLYSIAQSYRGAKDYEHAIAEYKLFLSTASPAPGPVLHDLVKCFIDEMQGEMEHAAATAEPTGIPPDDGATTVRKSDSMLEPPRWYSDTPGWIAVGSGAVVGTLAAYLFVDAANFRDQAATEPREDVRLQLRARADSRQTWGLVATGVAAVAMIVGVVKLAIVPHAPRPAPISLTVGPGGVALGGTF